MTQPTPTVTRVVVLDDYQGRAHAHADWSSLGCQVDFVREYLGDADALAERVAGAEVVVAMRERTSFPREVLERLADLRLLVTTGARNASIDVAAARELGVTVCGTESLPHLTRERAEEVGATPVGKEELLATSRFVTLHLKVGDRTRGILGRDDLAAMRPDAYLINTSCAALLDQDALIHALTSGGIAGAAIDVYDQEPLAPDHPLLTAPGTVLTPHLGYVVEQGYDLYYRQAVEDILAYRNGAPIRVLEA